MSGLLAWILLIQPLVCLGELDTIINHPNWELLNSDNCGMSNVDRIIGGVNANIGAYPWLARIGYVSSRFPRSEPSFLCAGSVISKLHILTAAHCVVNVPQKKVPVRIHLGEYNTITNPDCVLRDDHTICNEPYQDRDIEKVLAHENYDEDTSKNDIALIRVTKEITFTDFVRPICLVNGKMLENDFLGEVIEVAGWGVFDIVHPRPSIVLQTVKLPVLPISNCTNHKYYKHHLIDSTQLCIGGKAGKDSCIGDSGGPVMKIVTDHEHSLPRYYTIGIVSYGPSSCGKYDIPGVYTNISKFILWVLDNLRPLD